MSTSSALWGGTAHKSYATIASDISVGSLVVGPNGEQWPCTRGIFIGGGGNLVCKMINGLSDTIYGLVPGFYPFQITDITASGSTVTNVTLVF